jgi:PAS domain S-box-containing protein
MPHPERQPHSSFDEARKRIRRQFRRIQQVTQELRRLTLFLLDTDDATPDRIANWIASEGFASGPDGQFLPRPTIDRLRRGENSPQPELSYFWPEALQNDPLLRAHFHALRHLAGPMANQIDHLHQLPQFIYFQDARNGVITYPFIDSEGIIPPDFEWKTYYPWQVAGPEANPHRSFQWVTPTNDFGDQGPFVIGALPVYRGDECLGIWAMDIPLNRLHSTLFPAPPPTGHQNFIVDGQGRILLHPQFSPVVRPKDRLLIWKPMAILGGEFGQLDPLQLQTEGQGQKHLIDGEGRMINLSYYSLPDLHWILIGLAPIPEPVPVDLTIPENSPPDAQLFRETLELCVAQAQILKGWQQSYQALIGRFSAVFFSLSPTPKVTAIYVSPQVEQLLEYPASTFMDNPDLWRDLVLLEEILEHDRVFEEFLATGKPLHHIYRIRTRSGAVKWVREEAVLIRDPAGKPLLIQGLLFDVTEHKSTEENLRIREFEIRSLSDRLLELQEIERRNISAVLHDHMGQLLTLARLEIESLKIAPESRNSLDRGLHLIDDSLKAVRSLASSLHPPFLDDLELPEILELIIENFKHGAHLVIPLHCDPTLPPIPRALKTVIYRVVGEALTNVVRHSDARTVDIRLQPTSHPEGLVLTLRDDGHGFDPSGINRTGIGLISMRERIQQFGGDFSLTSTPGVGTQIILFIPTPHPRKAAHD